MGLPASVPGQPRPANRDSLRRGGGAGNRENRRAGVGGAEGREKMA